MINFDDGTSSGSVKPIINGLEWAITGGTASLERALTKLDGTVFRDPNRSTKEYSYDRKEHKNIAIVFMLVIYSNL